MHQDLVGLGRCLTQNNGRQYKQKLKIKALADIKVTAHRRSEIRKITASKENCVCFSNKIVWIVYLHLEAGLLCTNIGRFVRIIRTRGFSRVGGKKENGSTKLELLIPLSSKVKE